MSSLTIILYQGEHLVYTSTDGITPGSLSNSYLWYFVDTIPGLEIWSTFNVDNPVKTDGFLAQLLVFIFRLSIIIPSVMLFKEWLSSRQKKAEARLRKD